MDTNCGGYRMSNSNQNCHINKTLLCLLITVLTYNYNMSGIITKT